jgi:hypothetical protein
MANHSLDNLSDKRYVYPRSTNDKEDMISQRLHEHKVALQVMRGHPEVLNEYICAVKEGRTTHQNPEVIVVEELGHYAHPTTEY